MNYELQPVLFLAVSSGSAMRPLLFVLMKATRSSTEEFTISSFVVNSVRIASAVALYLFEKGCSPSRNKAYPIAFGNYIIENKICLCFSEVQGRKVVAVVIDFFSIMENDGAEGCYSVSVDKERN